MRAIHIICHPTPTGMKNLVPSPSEKNVYTSGCWALHSGDDPALLVGGWIYLHPRKNDPSLIGGIVRSFGSCERDAARLNGIEFEFVAKQEGRGQKWRGAAYDRAWTGQMVNADYEHEIASSARPFTE